MNNVIKRIPVVSVCSDLLPSWQSFQPVGNERIMSSSKHTGSAGPERFSKIEYLSFHSLLLFSALTTATMAAGLWPRGPPTGQLQQPLLAVVGPSLRRNSGRNLLAENTHSGLAFFFGKSDPLPKSHKLDKCIYCARVVGYANRVASMSAKNTRYSVSPNCLTSQRQLCNVTLFSSILERNAISGNGRMVKCLRCPRHF